MAEQRIKFIQFLLISAIVSQTKAGIPGGPLPNVTEFVETKLKTYDKYHMPPWSDGKPVNLQVGFYIESLSEFKATAMTFHLDMYLRLLWNDARVSHDGPSHLVFSEIEIMNKLWLPDIYFSNAQKSYFHAVTQPNRVMRILPSGHIQYAVRVSATISCNLELSNYPIDYQECFIKLLSYGYSREWLKVDWLELLPVEVNPQIALPELRLLHIVPEYCNGTYIFDNTIHIYSCLKATIKVQRQIGYHILQTYIPSGLIVVVSWASFWIDPASVPARTGMCITTLLTITTQAAGVRASLPPVSYAKAIDFWIGICTFMIFATLLEYVCVNSLMMKASSFTIEEKIERKHIQANRKKVDDISNIKIEAAERKSSNSTKDQKKLSKKYVKEAKLVDSISKFVFPIIFIVFNVIYWSIFIG